MATYTPASYTATAVPSAYELHVMKRLGCGWSPSTLAAVRAAGGIEAWLAQQLEPDSVPESPLVAQVDAWFPDLRRTPAQKAADNASKRKQHYKYGLDLANWTTLRRVHSTRPVLETMLDFWANHLHVSTGDEKAYTHLYDYHLVLRQHALGRFEDLLVAASTHPAMLLYLDNFRSVRNAPNENQGRELLELHTVTTEAGYSEDMVKDSAKLLSGWTVDWGGSYEGFYNTAAHTTGAVEVLGFSHPNTSSDGRAACEAYLRHLARHPATARTVAHRLAVRFVGDTPSDGLVAHLASVFTQSGTDIKATLLALVAHPEFRASAGQKVSTPVDDMVATLKALGVRGRAPTRDYGAGSYPLHLQYHHRGLRLFSWPRPDGCPETNFEWTSGIRMLGSYRFHWDLAGAYYPKADVSFVSARSRVPRSRLSFALYFDHLSRTLLGRPSTSRTLKAACLATGLSPSTVVTPSHAVGGWMFPHVASVLLDSPEHLTR
ncbi:Uncharacterized conserved protein, DUF1800 family [Nocardioides scoriae]|uniref:Uncharacterized conserved protein, DUF1800 family n=1 Tax=Nocardioides scoriae TaxID=642780 RepID=A0A1H1MN07_9ACTN|nr:DUF1800 domain-containing protein [Nocardioides scoriae]SDR88126.1 Uncharacterized conserved protein, DUF1800 family [Nocardioides scoriae]